VNFLGHLRVALAVSDEPAVLLGSILPDLESLLGPVLPDADREPAVARGIAIHRRSDAAFHADRRFIDGSIALTRALQGRGIARGASRGVGHAGWELLLDGALADDRATTDAFSAAIAALEDRAEPRAFAPFAERQRLEPIWVGYRDPDEVARRLQRQLARRPRLAFGVDDISVVGAELRSVQSSINELSATLLVDVTRAGTV
jgi:acyl carrier protein phosphodiesterase